MTRFLLPLFFASTLLAQEKPPEHPVLGRVITIGASLSHGFANGLPLSRMVEKTIVAPHRRVERASSDLFFMRPFDEGARQIQRVERVDATLVLGVDFLFWYSYGRLSLLRALLDGPQGTRIQEGEKESELPLRQRSLERGFAELEKLGKRRIVIGDIPDMTGAAESMLSPAQIPSPKVQAALNERIHAWAKGRPNVLVVPLRQWVADMKAGKMTMAAREKGAPKIELPAALILGDDRLHPSKAGMVVFTHLLMDKLVPWLGKDAAGALHFEVWETLETMGLAEELAAGKR